MLAGHGTSSIMITELMFSSAPHRWWRAGQGIPERSEQRG
jgi:hypothetical protein